MADNIDVTPGTGKTIAADDVGGALHQRVKPTWGADGVGNDTNETTPLPVQVRGSFNPAGATLTSGSTGYIPGDVVGGAVDLGVCGPSGGIVDIVAMSLLISTATLISGQGSYRVHFYNVTPPSAIADSSPWDLPSGDRASYLGYLDLPSVAVAGTNSLYCQSDNIGHRVKLSGTHLFAYLTSNGTYTPTAQTHTLNIHTSPA